MPATIKNAIDLGSRPYVYMKWAGKKVAVFSAALSMTAGLRAHYEVKTSTAFLKASALAQPEVMLSEIHKSFDENGNMVEDTKAYLQMFVDELVEFIK